MRYAKYTELVVGLGAEERVRSIHGNTENARVRWSCRPARLQAPDGGSREASVSAGPLAGSIDPR